jgi:hypothetical protein
MPTTKEERQELRSLRETVRYNIEALELCWSCQKISECESRLIDDGPTVRLCRHCLRTINVQSSRGHKNPVWPFGR